MKTRTIKNDRTFEVEAIVLTEGEYLRGTEDYEGRCVFCQQDAYECEPDARWRKCESCERYGVFGMEELLLMGLIEFSE